MSNSLLSGTKALTKIGSIILEELISWSISELSEGLDYLIHYEEKQKEVFEKAKTATKESAETIRNLKSEISATSTEASKLASEFARLVQGIDPLTNQNRKLSTDDYERFLSVNNQLAELFPSLRTQYDENGNAILGLSGTIDTVTDSISKLAEQKNTLARGDIRKHVEQYFNGTEENEGAFQALKGYKKDVQDAEGDLASLKKAYDDVMNGWDTSILADYSHSKESDEYFDDTRAQFRKSLYKILSDAKKEDIKNGKGNSTELRPETKDKITEVYRLYYEDLQTNLAVAKAELEAKNKEISSMVMEWVKDFDAYKNGDPVIKQAFETMVASLSWSELGVEDGDYDTAKQKVMPLLNDLSNVMKTPENKLKITNALTGLFSTDFSTMGYKKANENIKEYLTEILKTYNDKKSDEEKKSLLDMYDMFGFGSYDQTTVDMKKNLTGISRTNSALLPINPAEYAKLTAYTKDFNQAQTQAWLTSTTGAKSAAEAIQRYEEYIKNQSEIPKTFRQSWNSINTAGTDEQKSDKDKLLELAEAGRLTEEALKKTSLASVFEEAGVSIEEATRKVNAFADETKQLSAMKTGITAITSAYDEKENSSRNTVSSSTLESLGTTLGTADWKDSDKKVWENYKSVAGDSTKTLGELKEAQDELATSYVNSSSFLANIEEDTYDYYVSQLKEIGVTNAAAVARDALNRKMADTKLAGFNLSEASNDEITSLGNYITSLQGANGALGNYIIKKQLAGSANLETSGSIQNLINLATQCGATSEVLAALNELLIATDDLSSAKDKSLSDYNLSAGTDLKHAYDNLSAQKDADVEDQTVKVEKARNKVIKLLKRSKTAIITSPGIKTKNDTGSGKQKTEKQEFNWLERRLMRMQNIIDLTASKLQNLFSVKAKNKNLNKQITQSTKLVKQYGKAAIAYQKKADGIANGSKKEKGLSKNIVRQIKSGKLTKKDAKMSKKYSQSEYQKISDYINNYDKAREAEKNQAEQTAKIRELKKQKHQNYVDDADAKIALREQQKENAKSAEDKNNFLQKEAGLYETSYKHQINIARLEKDSVKVKRLRAELQEKLNALQTEQHQNLADHYQSELDLLSTQKEIAKSAAEKNSILTEEAKKTSQLYAEKIAITNLEGNTAEAIRLQLELNNQLNKLNIERHQNLADEYQSQIDLYAAYQDTLISAAEKNQSVEQEKAATSQLYAEKIAIAQLEGNTNEALRLQHEQTSQLVALDKKKLDNIAEYYEYQRKINENRSKNLDSAASELEARGLTVSKNLYASQIALNEENRKNRQEELAALTEQHGRIQEGTKEWYDSLDAIQACRDGIADCTMNILEIQKAIRQTDWKIFEKISAQFDLVSSEVDLFISMMADRKMMDETGAFTSEGTATLGARYSQLLIARRKTEALTGSLKAMKTNIDNGVEGYTDPAAMEEYNEAFRDNMDLKKEELQIEGEIIDMMKERYSAELEYMQDIIDKRKELLQAEKDEYDYRRTIGDKTKNISILSKQMNALSGDSSEAARAKIQQLQVSLDEAKQDLQDTEYDKWISDQQTMLDNLYNEYHDFMDDRMNDRDALLTEAVEYLDNENVGKVMSETLNHYGEKYNYDYSDSLGNIVTQLGEGGTSITTAIQNSSENIITSLKTMQENQSAADQLTADINRLQNFDTYDDYLKAKEAVKSYNNAPDEVKQLIPSQAKSNLDNLSKNISGSEAAAQQTQNLISAIGTVSLDSQNAIQTALNSYNGLSEISRQIVDKSGLTTTLHNANAAWTNLYNERLDKQNQVKQVLRATYLADGRTYANMTDEGIRPLSLDELFRQYGLYRDDNHSISESGASLIMNRLTGRTPQAGQGTTALYNYMKSIGFADGGIANTLQKVPLANGDDGWITIQRGESVLNKEQTKNLAALAHNLDTLSLTTDLTKNLAESRKSVLPEQGIHSTSIGDISMSIELPNVTNYEEFRRQMQSDPKIESMFKSMIWEKGNLSKYRTNM